MKAEALALANGADIYQLLRNSLSRGDFDESAKLLAQLREDASPDHVIERLLEESRLASFEGDWIECEALSASALKLAPTGITQLALRQVHATSLIETARYREARRELDLALTLSKLFTHSPLSTYVAATDVRLCVRLGEFAKAERALRRLWAKPLTADLAVVFARIELELRRAQNKPTDRLAFAIWLLCKKTGDRLYEALATRDLDVSSLRWEAVRAEAEFFKRARMTKLTFGTSSLEPDDFDAVTHVLFEEHNVAVHLESLEAAHVKYPAQVWTALAALELSPIARAEFFSRVWGSQKFTPHLHDDVIRTLVYRTRRATKLNLDVTDGELTLPTTLVVRK